jgi:hypothetical protein
VHFTLAGKLRSVHVIIYAVECFSEKKKDDAVITSTVYLHWPSNWTRETKQGCSWHSRIYGGKKQPLKITEKLIRFVDSKLHLKSTTHINVSSRLVRACTTRTRWALREREQSNNNYIKALIYIGEKLTLHANLLVQ